VIWINEEENRGFVGDAHSIPMFDDFDGLPQASFSGSGIPNNSVAITIVNSGQNTITLGLAATQRFSNPALGNDNNGTYFATTGSNFGGNNQSSNEGALWNFSFFMEIEGGGTFADFDFKVLYDFDPASNTPDSDLGIIDLNPFFNQDNLIQDSQNLLFSFLAIDSLFIDAPSGAFNPNVAGEYSFALIASNLPGFDEFEGRSAIDINVSAVPVPAALPLFGTGLAIMGFVGWRRRKAANA